MENFKKKKRRLEETGNKGESSSNGEIRSLVECIPKPQLVDLLCKLGSQDPSIAQEIKTIATPYAVTAGRKIFVNGLANVTNQFTLYDIFEQYGEIEKAFVIRDKATGKSKGYGFITYKDIESANNALRKPEKLIDGVRVACKLADEGQRVSLRRLHIGNLPPITNENLRRKFQMHGEIEEAVAYKNPKDAWKNGYGFVTYKTAEAAKKAIDYNTRHGRTMMVTYADSRPSFTAGVASREVLPTAPGPGFVQPENGYNPHTAAVPYAAPHNYQTYGQGTYPHGYVLTDQFGHQCYYDYPYPSR